MTRTRSDNVSNGDSDVVIDGETVARYRSDGAVCIRNVIDKKWIEAIEKVRRIIYLTSMSLANPTSIIRYWDNLGMWKIAYFGCFVRQLFIKKYAQIL